MPNYNCPICQKSNPSVREQNNHLLEHITALTDENKAIRSSESTTKTQEVYNSPMEKLKKSMSDQIEFLTMARTMATLQQPQQLTQPKELNDMMAMMNTFATIHSNALEQAKAQINSAQGEGSSFEEKAMLALLPSIAQGIQQKAASKVEAVPAVTPTANSQEQKTEVSTNYDVILNEDFAALEALVEPTQDGNGAQTQHN